MTKIFISYSRTDAAFVQDLAHLLDENRYHVWFDKELKGGDRWWDEITGHIQAFSVFLFVLSPNSIKSPYCLAEYEFAKYCNLHVLPVKVDNNFRIGKHDVHDLDNYQIITLQPDQLKANFGKLQDSLRKMSFKMPLPEPFKGPPLRPTGLLDEVERRIVSKEYESGDGSLLDKDINELWDALHLPKYKQQALTLLQKLTELDVSASYRRRIQDLLDQHTQKGTVSSEPEIRYESSLRIAALMDVEIDKIVKAVTPRTSAELIELSFYIQNCFKNNQFEENDERLEKLKRAADLNVKNPRRMRISTEMASNAQAFKKVLSLDDPDFANLIFSLYQMSIGLSVEKAGTLSRIPA